MKQKELTKKLVFKKTDIANLNADYMKTVKGGFTDPWDYMCNSLNDCGPTNLPGSECLSIGHTFCGECAP